MGFIEGFGKATSASKTSINRKTNPKLTSINVKPCLHPFVEVMISPNSSLTPGQACDLDGADVLLPQIEAEAVLADKAYDAQERVIEPLEQRGIQVVIPPKKNRKDQRPYDKELYKARHLIENFFAKLKQFRAIATRYDKRSVNFLGAIHLVASVILLA